MLNTLAPAERTPKRRARNHHSFYMTDRMADLAARIAKAEEERTGHRTGAGQIVDRAMQRYAADLAASGELTTIMNGSVDAAD